MQGNNWDKIIEDKLKNLEIPYEAGTWDALEKRMNNAVKATEKFDNAMRKRLSDIELNYQPMYWEMLAQRLEEEASLRNHLIRYKASEVLLIFLLLLTFVQLFPTRQPIDIDTTNSIPEIESIASVTNTYDQNTTNNSTPLINPNHLTNDNLINQIPPGTEVATQKNKIANSLLPIEKQDIKELLPLSANTSQDDVILVDFNAVNLNYSDIEAIESGELALLATPKKDIPVDLVLKKKAKTLQIGMFASSNIDHIQTPYEEFFDLKPTSRFNLGYGGGVSLTWNKGRMAWETALVYTHKEYTPANRAALYTNIANGLNVEALKDIELDIVQIPVQLNYYVNPVASSNKWKFYVSGGASLNLAVDADYYVGKIPATSLSIRNGNVLDDQFEFDKWQRSKFNKDASTSNADPESDILRDKGISKGLFDKEGNNSLKENTYFTISGGIGIEYILNDRHVIYGQPTYRKYLNFSKEGGVGPDNDRINSIELIIGVKTYIK